MIWLLFYLTSHLIGLNDDAEVTCTEVCLRNSVTITFPLDSFNRPHQLEIPQGKRVKKKNNKGGNQILLLQMLQVQNEQSVHNSDSSSL